MRTPRFSVVIPTYNEERFLPNILQDIAAQSWRPHEIIVADNKSKDGTRRIARKSGARVIMGGLPARGRNNGARATTTELIFFLDADVRLPERFFENAINEMRRRKLDITTAPSRPDQKPVKYAITFLATNAYTRLSAYTIPVAMGLCIICTRAAWKRVDGFDEHLELCEDNDFVERVAKEGYRFRVLRSTKIIASVRRFEQRGHIRTASKIVYTILRRITRGTYQNNTVEYGWGYAETKPDDKKSIDRQRIKPLSTQDRNAFIRKRTRR
ncbi:TPA: glycosyltransferase [Candidatus Woesearchaeota archaeon]|nr:glycosyltransferase [Candidatus Woesearchaeota archaeon]